MNPTVGARIEERTAAYAALPLFQAFREDRIPVERFRDFFKEQYMTARWFQDVIWAATEMADGPYVSFAQDHRRRDSGHHQWMKHDLQSFGLEAMTDEDWFRFEWLPTRIQMARILARCHAAGPEDRMVILACMESAGSVTLGTLNDYVVRHGLANRTLYLGRAHVEVEERQSDQIMEIARAVMLSCEARHLETVELVFGALETMFSDGGERYYGDLIGSPGR
jgi:hypothetical protein